MYASVPLRCHDARAIPGRYAYTLGQETDVIVNGQDCDLALNLLTIADHLQRSGWNTSAYGKVRRHFPCALSCVRTRVPSKRCLLACPRTSLTLRSWCDSGTRE